MKTPEPSKENPSAPNSAKFNGTDNPRHLRAITALLRRPMPRESLDKEAGCSNGPELVAELRRPMPRENLDTEAGCSNGPELVAELRRRGLEVPCKRINFVDRDGFICRPGVYFLTEGDRRKVHQWQARRTNGGAA